MRGRAALRAHTPEHDLRLVDGEPVRVGGVEAGGGADDALDIGDRPAAAADHVVVVVADPVLVAGGRAGRLDPPGQAALGEGPEDVVDGLGRHRVVVVPDGAGEGVGV